MRVIFFTNIPSPYRVDFFNELSKFCDLDVLFEAQVDLECPNNRVPETKLNFNHHYFSFDSNYKTLLLKGVVKGLISPCDRFILHTWYTRTELCLISLCRIFGFHYWIETDGNRLTLGENFLKYRFKKWIFKGADGIFSPCSGSDTYFMHYGVSSKYIFRYSFTSISQEDVLQEPLCQDEKIHIRKHLGISLDRKIVLTVGRFIPIKGFDILMKAIPNDLDLYIVGGEPSAEYIELRKQLGKEERIHLVDFCSKQELSQYYKAVDLFVLPTRNDSWGLVINEAMSFALPVITTDHCVAGMEMLDNQEITIVPAENVEALSSSISLLINDDNLRSRIGNRNLDYARVHTIQKMAMQHIEILQ